jgi:hypothetical protein
MRTEPLPLAPAVGARVVVVVRDVGMIRATLLDVSDRFVVLGDPLLGFYAEVPTGLVVDLDHAEPVEVVR